MTRKDYELIAKAIRSCPEAWLFPEAAEQLVQSLANALASTNARFNHNRFVDACRPLAKPEQNPT